MLRAIVEDGIDELGRLFGEKEQGDPLVAGLAMLVNEPKSQFIYGGGADSTVALMLPMLGIAALYFRYRRSDAHLQPGKLWDVMLWVSFVGFLIVGVWTLYSTFG